MYKFKSRVRHSEVNEEGVLSIPAMMRYITDCCMFHSISIEYDVKRLHDEGKGWYVTMWQVAINRRPVCGEEIIVKTWPYNFRGMLGFRNFTIEDTGGDVLVEVDSLWVFMDLINHKPASVPEKMAIDFHCEDKLDREWKPRKIVKCEELSTKIEQYEEDYHFTVRSMHMDTNYHMNNARYIEAAMEGIEDDSSISYIRAEYKNVAYKGDVVKVSYGELEEGMQASLYNEENEFAVVEISYDKK